MERKTCHGLGGVGRLSFRDYRVYAAKASGGEHAKVVWIPGGEGQDPSRPVQSDKSYEGQRNAGLRAAGSGPPPGLSRPGAAGKTCASAAAVGLRAPPPPAPRFQLLPEHWEL